MDTEIIKIAANTTNYKSVNNYSHKVKFNNSLCGDEIKIYLKIKNNKIIDFGYQTKSCIYCQASASLLSRKTKNMKIPEIKQFLLLANNLFKSGKVKVPKYWNVFKKIFKKENNSRKSCLLLPINALMKIMGSI